jgi:hypothetical protein
MLNRKDVDAIFRGGRILIWDIYKVWYNMNWIFLTQDREDWQAYVNLEMQFWVQ